MDQPTTDGLNLHSKQNCKPMRHKIAYSGLGGDELFQIMEH